MAGLRTTDALITVQQWCPLDPSIDKIRVSQTFQIAEPFSNYFCLAEPSTLFINFCSHYIK